MDHYRVLGLSRNASNDEIKQAFRRLAVELHPDKHSNSPNSVRDSATLRFKQVSDAYQVLSDRRKRADYDFRSRSGNSSSAGSRPNYGYGYGYGNYNHGNYHNNNNYGGGQRYYKPSSSSSSSFDGLVYRFDIFLRFLTTRTFLLNAAFASALLGGMFIVDTSKEAIWKMHNSGKSFEEAMESIEKAKADKDKK